MLLIRNHDVADKSKRQTGTQWRVTTNTALLFRRRTNHGARRSCLLADQGIRIEDLK